MYSFVKTQFWPMIFEALAGVWIPAMEWFVFGRKWIGYSSGNILHIRTGLFVAGGSRNSMPEFGRILENPESGGLFFATRIRSSRPVFQPGFDPENPNSNSEKLFLQKINYFIYFQLLLINLKIILLFKLIN